ncbi:MAG: hypothetical protein KA777_01310 [Rhodoferax sp.]|nr:hypothetical protein [Rhodoferax sp.]
MMKQTILDDLDALTPTPVETFAFWTLIAMMAALCVGLVSFATGLLWADYIHPGIVHVLVWWVGLMP